MTDPQETAAWIASEIARYVAESPLNRLERIDASPMFDTPLVGVAAGDDPLFGAYKEIIGPPHRTPREALEVEGGPVSVVCWVLPIARATRRQNADQLTSPAERWAHTRTSGEAFNDSLRQHVVEVLQAAGHVTVAPVLAPWFKTYNEGVVRPPASNWSERHVLYAAGLGTFGLSDGFITPVGIAHRCGSVVVDLDLPPTPRTYTSHTENCLYLSEGTCGVCIARCPAGAITRQGHDKALCREYTYDSDESQRWRETYGVSVPGCGLCQTGVPCEDRVPARQKKQV